MNFFVVGLGGCLGALARYSSALLVARFWGQAFPLATLLINFVACLLAGVLMGVAEVRAVSPTLVLFLGMGFLGSYSTFSTLAVESFSLLQMRELGLLALNLGLSLLLGILAVTLGRAAVVGF
ncbi:MAG: CrcB family protein [Bdellovibrionaceae bacterium]|nr:CrcB family protein [Pseudobdellovibrionaceae bacterium]